jgi:transcriptional regulator with XRE-family HTH domain
MISDLVAEPLSKRVSKEVRAEMARQGVSQTMLGRLMGRPQSYVSYRLTGKTSLTLDDLESIAHILHTPLEQLLLIAMPAPRRRAS